MKRNHKIILGTAALTAIGVGGGAALAAQGNEQPATQSVTAVASESQPAVSASIVPTDETSAATDDTSAGSDTEAKDTTENSAEDQGPIVGTDLDKAIEIALQVTGGGKVTETELNDEEGFYEVEVTLDSGRQVDVHLDQNFKVIDSSSD